MTARYLRTRFATDFDESQSVSELLQRKLLFFVPKANPGYEPKLHEVEEWIVEFDADGLPHREIGLSASGAIVVAGPNDRDYGFWLDTNANYDDFNGEAVSEQEFERLWSESAGYRNGQFA